MANTSIFAAFERMWQHITTALNNKSDIDHIQRTTSGGTGLTSVETNNFLVGNGTDAMVQKTPTEVLSMINGASVRTMTTAEYEALGVNGTSANTLYMLTDSEEEDIVQAQPDWNANEGEPGHVLNRTHWVEGGMVEILPECQPEYDENEMAFKVAQVVEGVEVGKTYTVNWNGTEYECIAREFAPEPGVVIPILGDFSIADPTAPSTGEPFTIQIIPALMVQYAGFGMAAYVFDGTTELTLSIHQESEIVHKLPGKFLPNGHQFGEVDTVILPETTLTFEAMEQMGGMSIAMVPLQTLPIDGRIYKVNWNGKEYECDYIHFGDEGYLGNLGALEGGVNSGEPFICMVSVYDKYLIVFPIDDSTEATISINGIHPVPIAPEYAPPCAEINLIAAGLPTVVDTNAVQADVDVNLYRAIQSAAKAGVCKIKVGIQCEKYMDPLSDTDTTPTGFDEQVFVVNIVDDGSGLYTLQGIYRNMLLYIELQNSVMTARVRGIALL